MGFNGPRFLNPPPSHPLGEEGYYSIFYPFKYNKFFLFFAYKSMERNRKTGNGGLDLNMIYDRENPVPGTPSRFIISAQGVCT